MSATDSRIDAYIEKSAPFAKPVLQHIRELVHKACPAVEETMKWSFPHFDYKGIMCSMASFKHHCAFSFWKASIMKDPERILKIKDRESMGHFDKISSLEDLPSDEVLIAYIKEAARLNDEEIKLPSKTKRLEKKELEIPDYLTAALKKNEKAQTCFDNFSPSHKREYIEWITEAKTEATRMKRIETAIEWLVEGKIRNWKYLK